MLQERDWLISPLKLTLGKSSCKPPSCPVIFYLYTKIIKSNEKPFQLVRLFIGKIRNFPLCFSIF